MRCKRQKNFTLCCGGVRRRASTGWMMNLIMKAAATPTPEHHIAKSPHRDITTSQQQQILLSPRRSCYLFERMVHTILSKIFVAVAMWCRVVRRGLRCFHNQVHHPVCTGAPSYSTTTHCKIFLSLASHFLLCYNA